MKCIRAKGGAMKAADVISVLCVDDHQTCHCGRKGAQARRHHRPGSHDRGVSTHTGTVPSKSICEAIFQLTGFAVKARYGNEPRNHGGISLRDVSSRVSAVVERETEVVRAQLTRNGIDIYQGDALFLD